MCCFFFVVAILWRTKVFRLTVIGPFLRNLRILNLETSHNYLMASMCALVPGKSATKGKGWHPTEHTMLWTIIYHSWNSFAIHFVSSKNPWNFPFPELWPSKTQIDAPTQSLQEKPMDFLVANAVSWTRTLHSSQACARKAFAQSMMRTKLPKNIFARVRNMSNSFWKFLHHSKAHPFFSTLPETDEYFLKIWCLVHWFLRSFWDKPPIFPGTNMVSGIRFHRKEGYVLHLQQGMNLSNSCGQDGTLISGLGGG